MSRTECRPFLCYSFEYLAAKRPLLCLVFLSALFSNIILLPMVASLQALFGPLLGVMRAVCITSKHTLYSVPSVDVHEVEIANICSCDALSWRRRAESLGYDK